MFSKHDTSTQQYTYIRRVHVDEYRLGYKIHLMDLVRSLKIKKEEKKNALYPNFGKFFSSLENDR